MSLRAIGQGDFELVCHHRESLFREMGRDDTVLATMREPFRRWLAPRLEDGTYFGFGNGQAGGQVVITNWNASDVIGLTGYAGDAGAVAAAGQQDVGGSTRVTLSDNTEITFLDIGDVSASRFV